MELTPFFFGLYKFVKYSLYPLTWVVLTGGDARAFGTGPQEAVAEVAGMAIYWLAGSSSLMSR